jgi:DNA-directed RNA polymerase subunit M/transcription elongation factor TFIIS
MRGAIKFKSCPKCRGDLYLGEDLFGHYLSCLQCGYLKDFSAEEEAAFKRELIAAAGERKAA